MKKIEYCNALKVNREVPALRRTLSKIVHSVRNFVPKYAQFVMLEGFPSVVFDVFFCRKGELPLRFLFSLPKIKEVIKMTLQICILIVIVIIVFLLIVSILILSHKKSSNKTTIDLDFFKLFKIHVEHSSKK